MPITENQSADTVLSIRNLNIALPKGADRALAVEDVSYDVKRGEIMCVVGESGSGNRWPLTP